MGFPFHCALDPKFDYVEFAELVGAASPAKAEFFEVDQRTLKRWLAGEARIPGAVMKLARLRFQGDLSALFGREWSEISFCGGLLFLPGWRRGFTPGELRSHFYAHQARYALTFRVQERERELSRREAELDAMEDRADFYRRQVRLESKLGAMLASITA